MKKPAKLLATVAIAGALALGSPLAASADVNDNYTPSSQSESVQIAPGQSGTVAFDGFQPNEDVTFTLTGENASDGSLAIIVKAAVETISTTKTADANGTASVEVTLPANAVGTYTLTATGAESDASASTTIETGVAAPQQPGNNGNNNENDDDSLSPTGGDMSSIGLWVGGGALLLGGGAVVAATAVRRQRQN